MTRGHSSRLKKLSAKEKAARKERNRLRGRSPRERAWARDHIVKQKADVIREVTTVRTRSKASIMKTIISARIQNAVHDLDKLPKPTTADEPEDEDDA